MECGTLTFRSTGQALKFCDKIHEFEKIFLMFKCFNLASKARHFFLQTLVTIGLPKEMRMLGKMSVDIGVDMALLPALCKELLQSVEVDLFCDDSKQAQVKLREVESLLQEDLRSQPRKTKTKSRYVIYKASHIEPDIMALTDRNMQVKYCLKIVLANPEIGNF